MKTVCCLLLVLCVLSGCQSTGEHVAKNSVKPNNSVADSVPVVEPFRLYDYELVLKDVKQYWPHTSETRRLLDDLVTLQTQNITLKAIIDFIRVETDANLAVNWPALELVGIDQDTLVTNRTSDVPAWKLLELVLAQAGADAFDDDKPGFQARDGVVSISTLRELKSHTVVRAYDVSWYINNDLSLMYQLYDKPKPKPADDPGQPKPPIEHQDQIGPEARDDARLKSARWCATCVSSDELDDVFDNESQHVLSRVELIDQVIELIHVSVGDPDEWLDEMSSITELRGVLLIKTTRENHEHIAALLKTLHQSRIQIFERRARLREVAKLLKEAENHRMQQQYPEALKQIDQALKVDPGFAETHVLRKIVMQAMGG